MFIIEGHSIAVRLSIHHTACIIVLRIIYRSYRSIFLFYFLLASLPFPSLPLRPGINLAVERSLARNFINLIENLLSA